MSTNDTPGFENTVTPEEAEEFDRMAAERIAKCKQMRLTREQLLQRARDLIAAVDAFSFDVHAAYGFPTQYSSAHQKLVPFRSSLEVVRTAITSAAGKLAMLPEPNEF